MKVVKADFSGTELALRSLLSVHLAGSADLEFGSAVMPRGCRQPPQGVSRHDGDEISLLLRGRAVLETADGRIEVRAGDVVFINAGEAHATEALEDCHVYYVLSKAAAPAGQGGGDATRSE